MSLFNKILEYFDLNNRSPRIIEEVRNRDPSGFPENRFSPKLKKWVDEQRETDRKYLEEMEKKFPLCPEETRHRIVCQLRNARKSDYDNWLSKYIKAGGKPTHWYDYPWDRWNSGKRSWFIANKDIELRPLYGANSINIIILPGIKVTGKRGHIDLFRYDDIGKPVGKYECQFVPVFCDTEA